MSQELGRTSHLGLWTDACGDEEGKGSTQAQQSRNRKKAVDSNPPG